MTSETTPALGLQLTAAGQAMKHVTVNEALLRLDALVHLTVKERNRNAPPASPANGDRYLVGTAPTGAFAGHAGTIASYDVGVWTFLTPHTGWRAYVMAEAGLFAFNGADWAGATPSGSIAELQNLSRLGLGATADATNPLSVKAGNALFAATSTPTGTGDLRFKLNKDAAGNTLSQLYQTAYSGRAETGLIGNDRYAVKVSADGSAWKLALDIDGATGVVSAPQGLAGDKAAFRNRIINGNFALNQRAVTGTVTLAAGAFGHDRWKAGASGCTYAFATSGADTTITITAGSLVQPIEGANVGEGGGYILSWSGTSTARCYQGAATGSYAAGPIALTGLTAGTDLCAEFISGTLARAQLEPGAIVTGFERRHIGIETKLCQRYFTRVIAALDYAASSAGEVLAVPVSFPAGMRATPSLSAEAVPQTSNISSISYNRITTFGAGFQAISAAAGRTYWYGAVFISAEI